MSILGQLGNMFSGGMSPSFAMKYLRETVDSELGFHAERFEVWVDPGKETIEIRVQVGEEHRKYPVNNDMLMPIVRGGISRYLAGNMAKGTEIHMLSLVVNGKTVTGSLYFELEGKKDCIEQTFDI